MNASLDERLAEWRFFEECLIHNVRPVKFGFGLDLVMNYVWSDGKVREDVLDAPFLVTLRMLGLNSLRFDGGLTTSMRRDPEAINWGLAEIARIVPVPISSDLSLAVEWEGSRRLVAEFSKIEFLVPEEVRQR